MAKDGKPKDRKPKKKDGGEPKAPRGGGGGGFRPLRWLLVLIALAAVYVLSVFPVAWLHRRGYLAEVPYAVPIAQAVYAPLFWCARTWRPVGELYGRGLELIGAK